MFDDAFFDALAKKLAPRLIEQMKPLLTANVPVRYLSVPQAADYMSTTPDAVRGMLRQKHFPCRKIGARVFIDVRDIDNAMDAAKAWV